MLTRLQRALGVLDHAALLRAWSETTPRAIHPGRRIGRLEPGHEASFLVLDGDPLADFTNVTRIRGAVKEGHGGPVTRPRPCATGRPVPD